MMTIRSLSRSVLLFLFAVTISLAIRPCGAVWARSETSSDFEGQQARQEKVKAEESDKAPRAGEEWFSRGYQLHRSDRYPEAIEAFKHSIDLGYREATAMYNIACGYALEGDRSSAIEWLEKSVRAGFDNNERINSDPDIRSLRVDPRFSRIANASRALSLSQFFENSHGSLYSKAKWAPAVQLYQSLVETEPNNGRAWFNLGYALHYSREHARAIEAFEHGRQLGYQRPISTYNIACAYSMLEQRELAFEWLERAVADGYDQNDYLSGDRDLDNLRSDPRFERLVKNYGNDR